MADVEFGFVHDFGADEEFSAVRGRGRATRTASRSSPSGPTRGWRWSRVESASPERIAPVAAALAGPRVPAARARLDRDLARLRRRGPLRRDAQRARDCRSVDAAAGQLIVREAGGLVGFGELGLADAELDLDARYPIAAALDSDGLATVLEVQRASPGRCNPTCPQKGYKHVFGLLG